ncbi:hypothetical protein [Mesorhizobium sp. M1399]
MLVAIALANKMARGDEPNGRNHRTDLDQENQLEPKSHCAGVEIWT